MIEVDGETHAVTKRRDDARTRFIEGEGFRVIRFWNNEVMRNIDGVITPIAAIPSPLVGEGSGAPDEGE